MHTDIKEVTPFQMGESFAREKKDYCPYQDPKAIKEFYLGVASYKHRINGYESRAKD
jgi:hypothetical protein